MQREDSHYLCITSLQEILESADTPSALGMVAEPNDRREDESQRTVPVRSPPRD